MLVNSSLSSHLVCLQPAALHTPATLLLIRDTAVMFQKVPIKADFLVIYIVATGCFHASGKMPRSCICGWFVATRCSHALDRIPWSCSAKGIAMACRYTYTYLYLMNSK